MAGNLVSPPSASVVVDGQPGNLAYEQQLASSLASVVTAVGALPDLLWGTAVLVSGEAVVSCGQIASGSLVFLSRMGVAGTPGHLSVPSITPGVSFTIASSSATDASAVAYLIIP